MDLIHRQVPIKKAFVLMSFNLSGKVVLDKSIIAKKRTLVGTWRQKKLILASRGT